MNGFTEEKRYPGVIKERLGIEVTTQCNIECAHCFARNGISEKSSLSPEFVKKIIKEGHDTGYRHLHVTGGEPLIWQGLFEALDYAFNLGYHSVFLNTNGTLLTAEIANKLATYDDISISVSLEGSEALHERLRAKGSYRSTVRGIEKALGAGINLSIFTTACKSLLPELHRFEVDLYKKFESISDLTLIQLIPVAGGPPALTDELLEPQDLLELVSMVSLLNLLGYKTRFLNNPLIYAASKLLKILWIPRSRPLYSEGRLIVMANRDMRLSHSDRYGFGKYEQGMLGKVLASDGYRKAVAPDEKICPSCRHADFCAENGMVRPSESYWDIQSDEHYCQKVLDGAVQ